MLKWMHTTHSRKQRSEFTKRFIRRTLIQRLFFFVATCISELVPVLVHHLDDQSTLVSQVVDQELLWGLPLEVPAQNAACGGVLRLAHAEAHVVCTGAASECAICITVQLIGVIDVYIMLGMLSCRLIPQILLMCPQNFAIKHDCSSSPKWETVDVCDSTLCCDLKVCHCAWKGLSWVALFALMPAFCTNAESSTMCRWYSCEGLFCRYRLCLIVY